MIHLQPTGLHPEGRSLRIQVLFSIIDLISLSTASFQEGDSKEVIASLKELGSPSRLLQDR